MRKSFGTKAWVYPMPVFIIATYAKDGTPDAMNAAWGGISDYTKISFSLSKEHKTVANLMDGSDFTVSMATVGQLPACDYVGLVSGNDVPDKLDRAGFHAEKSEVVNAPVLRELPMTLECRFLSFDEENGITTGEIVNILADESILDEQGNIAPEKLQPVTFDPVQNTYRAMGEVAGAAFDIGTALMK